MKLPQWNASTAAGVVALTALGFLIATRHGFRGVVIDLSA